MLEDLIQPSKEHYETKQSHNSVPMRDFIDFGPKYETTKFELTDKFRFSIK